MSLVNLIKLQTHGDARGSLVAIDEGTVVPFAVKRVYYLYHTVEGVSRGYHAHKQLKQVAVCVSGKCKMILDDGQVREEVWLDHPDKGVLIDDMVWHEMHEFSKDCVLLVLASEVYDESDYIRDYDSFLAAQGVQVG